MRLKKITIFSLAAWMPAALLALGGGTTNSDFMKLGVGARPAAMGEAFVAAADDVNATYWNPAGLALVEKAQVSAMHMVHIADINYDTLSLAFPSSRFDGWGLSVAYLWQAPFDSTQGAEQFGVPVNSEKGEGSDLAASLSYAHNFGNYRTTDFNISNISVGGTLRLINRTLQDKTSSGLMADLGVVMEVLEGLRLGLVAQNFGTTTTFISAADNAPVNMKLGSSYRKGFFDNQHIIGLVYDVGHPIDSENSEHQVWRQSMGVEYWMMNTLALRGGYKFGVDTGGLTAGAGFKFGTFSIDYAFVPFSELGDSHRVSGSIEFGGIMPRPEIAAPGKPRHLSAIAGDRFVSLAWKANPEKDVVGYNVYYSKRKGKDYVRTNEKPEPRQTSLKVRLQNEQNYYFAVTAVNAAGKESEFSRDVSVRPSAPAKPGTPTRLRSNIRGRTVELHWNEVKNKRVVGYHVYYSKTRGKRYRRLTKGAPLAEAECKLRGLSPGKDYYFVITSITKEGLESGYSNEVKGRPKMTTLERDSKVKKPSKSGKKKQKTIFDEAF